MKITIFCVIAILATSLSTAEVADYSLYSAGEGTPVFAFQPVLKNPRREYAGGYWNTAKATGEFPDIIEDKQGPEKNDDDFVGRIKREADPGDDQEKGRVEVDVNRERGQGTRVDATVSRRVWESQDGRGRIDVQGNYGRTYGGPGGTGKPNYGGRINYSHRFRREAQSQDNEQRVRVGVDVSGGGNTGTRVDARGTGNVWKSPDGNRRVDVQGHYGRTYGGPGGTGRPNSGGMITYTQRFRREVAAGDEHGEGRAESNDNAEEIVECQTDHSSRIKREANPDDNQGRAGVEVEVEGRRGQGARVDARVTGNVWESKDGTHRVDVEGNYGRTFGGPDRTGDPTYGGHVTYSHRREGDAQDRCRVDLDINRRRGEGRMDITGTGTLWESKDGNARVEVEGNYGRSLGGHHGNESPNIGGRVTYTHRFGRAAIADDEHVVEAKENIPESEEEMDSHVSRAKREANPEDNQDRGRVEVDVNRERGQGTRVDARATGKVWESRDGNGRVDVQGNYGRTYGGPRGTGRPNYGGRITYSRRFRRSLQPREEERRQPGGGNNEGRVSVDVNVDKQKGEGTRVDVTGRGRLWESRDGDSQVDVHGNYGRTYGGPDGTGSPSYGGGITYSRRFRRSLQPREEERRQPGGGNDEGRGSVDVNVDRQKGQGTRVDVTGHGRVWESRDRNGRVDVHGNYGRTYGGPGGTGRPNYGGRITYSHRF